VLQNEIPFGEKLINDLVIEKYGNHNLFTAAGNSVKIWDLKQLVFGANVNFLSAHEPFQDPSSPSLSFLSDNQIFFKKEIY
jgi:hypothetical protein